MTSTARQHPRAECGVREPPIRDPRRFAPQRTARRPGRWGERRFGRLPDWLGL